MLAQLLVVALVALVVGLGAVTVAAVHIAVKEQRKRMAAEERNRHFWRTWHRQQDEARRDGESA